MKMLGMLGGMSCESTQIYYAALNRAAQQRLGGASSASVLIRSFNFQEIAGMQNRGDWDGLHQKLAAAAQSLERGGAEGIIICANTMHISAPHIARATSAPLLHIADALGQNIRARGVQKIGLLGTKFTMEKDFLKEKLREDYNLEVLIPNEAEREKLHGAIYGELVKGIVRDETRKLLADIAESLARRGAEGAALACTELGMAMESAELPLFDTAKLHAEYAAEWMLA